MQVILDVPDELLTSLLPAGEDASHVLLEDALVQAYREQKITGTQLMAALRLESRFELEATLKRHRVWLDYTPEELENERRLMEELLAGRLRHAS